jgi:hypothetical protein
LRQRRTGDEVHTVTCWSTPPEHEEREDGNVEDLLGPDCQVGKWAGDEGGDHPVVDV